MEKNQESLAILYWGRRGGGLELFNQLVRDAKLENLHVLDSSRPLINQDCYPARQVSSLNVYRWLRARRSFKSQIAQQNIKNVLIVMASPWDIMLGKALMNNKVEVVRIIHDGKPHPGEWFPTNFWIKWLTRDCSRIFTLSAFVADQLVRCYSVDRRKITVSQFPRPKIDLGNVGKKETRVKKRVLLIGRGKKYQGQKLLEKAWNLTSQENLELVIAGKGFKPNHDLKNVIYKNWWMSNMELASEINNSDFVCFPYIEASQSGTIPICRELGIPVLVTPVGGLPEQVENGKTGLVTDDLTPQSLAKGILEMLSNDLFITPKTIEESQRELIRKITGIRECE